MSDDIGLPAEHIYRGRTDVPDDVVANYLATHGMRQYTEYHPASSFWSFQAIEAAEYLGLAAALLATTV